VRLDNDRVYLTLPQPCPACGEPNDGHYRTTDHGGAPNPGSASVCAYCLTVGIFAEDGIRLPTRTEAAELAVDAEVQRAVAISRMWRSVLRDVPRWDWP
jgi:hypothetical protein